MENTIYDSNKDETIGFYEDIFKGYKSLISEALGRNDIEEMESLTEELSEIMDWKDYEDLLVLSENNGMGFTCKPYKEK